MRSCLGVIVLAFLLAVILGIGGSIFYLSHTAEFSRTDQPQDLPEN